MRPKRFIAGAVCPSCGAMDTVRTFTHSGKEHRECVECGYSDVMNFEPTLEGALPEARIDREGRVPDNSVDIVRILA